MTVYLFMLLICCFGGVFAGKMNNKKKYIVGFLLAFLSLFIVSGFRYMVGRDYLDTYVYTFYRILYGTQNVRTDIGFYYLNKLIIFFNGSYQWVFIITSFIINFLVVKTIFEKSNNKFLSLFIYICGTLYFFSMNGVRQTIALVLFYYSLKYIEEKNIKKYMIINVIGALFHNSAVIFIPLYFLISKKYKLKNKLIVLCGTVLSLSFLLPIINDFLLNTKYAMYLTNGAYNPLETINVSTIINILLFVGYELYYKKNTFDARYNIYSNIHFIGIIISLFITKISLAMRIFIYFRYIEFLSVPYLLAKLKLNKKNLPIVIFAVIIIYFIYFIHGVYIENGNTVLPYRSIFFK